MANELEYLFGNKMKVRILKLLILNLKNNFTKKEIVSHTKGSVKEIGKELSKMKKNGLIKVIQRKKEKTYHLNPLFPFLEELKRMIEKYNLDLKNQNIEELKNIGDLVFVGLTGFFSGNRKSAVDLIIAGDHIKKEKLSKIIGNIEADSGKELRYSVLSCQEFFYRLDMMDKFILDIINGPKTVIIDRIRDKKGKKYNQF